MEIFRSHKKNVKIYNKINYIKLLLVFSISFLLFSLFFYYIGREQNLDRSVLTSFAIAILLCVGSIIGDLIDNRSRIFLLNKDKLGYIEIHKDSLGGEYLRENEYFEVVDKSKLPLEFLKVDEVAIRNAIRNGDREIAGVKIFQKPQIALR